MLSLTAAVKGVLQAMQLLCALLSLAAAVKSALVLPYQPFSDVCFYFVVY